jgi:hypothetical protein
VTDLAATVAKATNGAPPATEPLTEAQIQDRIKALEARRQERANERQAKHAHGKALRQLELAEAIERAELDHGPEGTHILVLDTETEHGSVILKRPHKARYRAYQEKRNTKTEDTEALVRTCIVYPDAARLDRLLDELPGALGRFGLAMAKLAGHRQDDLESK